MLSHIHHINFVVKDLSTASAYFNSLLQQQPTVEELPQRHVNTARYKLGETLLVLIQPLTTNGVVADILAKKGEGIFLLSFATQSIDDTLAQLDAKKTKNPQNRGFASEKRKGLDGWEICDLTPIEQFGAILQLTRINNH